MTSTSGDDKIVTTPGVVGTSTLLWIATKDLGEAKAPASSMEYFTTAWCRRGAVFSVLALCLVFSAVAEAVPEGRQRESEESAQEPADQRFYRAYLDEVLRGDGASAGAGYESVLGAGASFPVLVAEAALTLAKWISGNRDRRRQAMDLAVRASVLGADQARLVVPAEKLRRRLATTVRAQDLEVRGPKAGTPLRGVSPEAAAAFAEAEELLAAYHRRRLQPRLEALAAGMRGKRQAMERAVRAYRAVEELGEKTASVAATFRIASLYYDYSLSLSFDLPAELSLEVARQIRSSLRAEVRQERAKAQAAYRQSLSYAAGAGEDASPWSEAAKLGLASVEDLLRTAG